MFRNFLYSLGQRINSFMYRRYGYDALSRFISVACITLFFLHIITGIWLLYLLAFVLLIWSVFRTLSRNYEARRKELNKYLSFSGRITGWFRLRKRMFNERKTTKYYRCKSCKAYLRVPKGRGKLEISCPKCKNTFIKTT